LLIDFIGKLFSWLIDKMKIHFAFPMKRANSMTENGEKSTIANRVEEKNGKRLINLMILHH